MAVWREMRRRTTSPMSWGVPVTTSTITPGFRDRSSGSLWWKAQNIGIYFIEGIQATLTRYNVLAYPWEGRWLCHTYHSCRRGAHRSQNLAERAAGQYDPQSALFGWPAQTWSEPAAAPSLHVPGKVSAVSNPSASVQWRHRRCCHRVWWSLPLLVRQEAVHSRRYRGAQQLCSQSNSLACLAFRPTKIVKLSVKRTLQIISLERPFIGDKRERKQGERGGMYVHQITCSCDTERERVCTSFRAP